MKLADRIKTIDWKEFGINHGEKIALGVVSLLVVMILFMGTRWKTFQEKQPQELTKKVEEESLALQAGTWPEEEQEVYTDKYDVNSVYENTYSVVEADKFRYPIGHPMVWSLHRQQEPIEEPTYLPVKELVATAGRFILELPPEGEEAVTDGALVLAEEDKPGVLSEREARRRQFQAQTPRQGGAEGGDYMGGYEPPDCPEDMYMGGDSYMDDPEGMMSGAGGTGVTINMRGVRFIAVRGLFPFREQVEKITDARNDPRFRNPYRLCDILDFEIQRQEAMPGPNPWSEDDQDWTTLDYTIGLELLAETANYADDVVEDTHWVITSPLPMRLTGSWLPWFVGHPKIRTLSERQIQLRRLLDQQLVLLEKEAKLAAPEDAVGGFAYAQRNRQDLEYGIGTNEGMLTRLKRNLQQSLDTGEDGQVSLPPELMSMLSTDQTPEYLLFRYFDYDVEPGQAYRYRVRLKLRNPNRYELPENLASPDVGKGDVRWTPWSEPTPESVMTDDSEFFVEDVSRGRYEPSAKIDLYQWLSQVGTTANKIVEVKMGQLIGQPAPPEDTKDEGKMVEVLRPFQSFKPEPIDLITDDAVVDFAVPPPRTRRDFHAKLDVRELNPLSQVLVVNEYGELENRNPLSQYEDHQFAQELLEAEYADWEYLKRSAQPAEGEGEYYEEGGDTGDLIREGGAGRGGGGRGGAEAGGRGGGGRGGGGEANPLRRNRPGGTPPGEV